MFHCNHRAIATLVFALTAIAGLPSFRVALADADASFISVSVSDVRLFSFFVTSGEMVPEARPWIESNGTTLTSKPFSFPLDRHFIVALKFKFQLGASSGYNLPMGEALNGTVDGQHRYAWRDVYLHGQTYMNGKPSKNAYAWMFVTLDLACDPVDVGVLFRNKRLKRIRIVGRCPE